MRHTGKNIAEQIVCQLSRLNQAVVLTELTKTFARQVTCSTNEKYNTSIQTYFPKQESL
jgi:hypothetical protein